MIEHLTIKSHYDNLPLDALIVAPLHPKGIIYISHGMCEHKERYIPFMNFLKNHGYVCIIHDHRGHGHSVYSNEDLGYFYSKGNIGIVEDLYQLIQAIKKRYPQLPLYLFGHSMGSLVVRCYAKTYDDTIDGLFVCGSPSNNKAATLGILACDILSVFKSDTYRSPFIHKISFSSFNKNFDTHTPNSWICSDPKVVEEYNNNPLCSFQFTNNGYKCLFSLVKETYSKNKWLLKKPELPIMFVAGQNDPCIKNEKKFIEAINFMKQRGYNHVDYKLFENMRHEILNEKDKEIVFNFILDTLDSWQ